MQQAAMGPQRTPQSSGSRAATAAGRSGSVDGPGKASTLVGHTKCVTTVAWHPWDPIIASSSEDNTVKLWAAEDGQCMATLEGHKGAVYGCAFSPEGHSLVSCSNDRSLHIWDLAPAHPTIATTLRGHTGPVRACAFSPNGEFIGSASHDGTARLWDPKKSGLKACIRKWSTHKGKNWACEFSPDSTVLATAGDDSVVRIYHIASGELSFRLQHSSPVNDLSFHCDTNHLLLTGSGDGKLRCWDWGTGKELPPMEDSARPIMACSLCHKGDLMAVSADDMVIHVIHQSTNVHLATLFGHTSLVNSCKFSPDNAYLCSGAKDKTVRLWKLELSMPAEAELFPVSSSGLHRVNTRLDEKTANAAAKRAILVQQWQNSNADVMNALNTTHHNRSQYEGFEAILLILQRWSHINQFNCVQNWRVKYRRQRLKVKHSQHWLKSMFLARQLVQIKQYFMRQCLLNWARKMNQSIEEELTDVNRAQVVAIDTLRASLDSSRAETAAALRECEILRQGLGQQGPSLNQQPLAGLGSSSNGVSGLSTDVIELQEMLQSARAKLLEQASHARHGGGSGSGIGAGGNTVSEAQIARIQENLTEMTRQNEHLAAAYHHVKHDCAGQFALLCNYYVN